MSRALLVIAVAASMARATPAQQDPWTDAFSFDAVEVPAGIDPQIGGIDVTPSGRLAICFHRGEVLFHDPASGAWTEFASGLHEPLGLLVESETSLLVMQRCELTRLSDIDGDGRADDYQTVFDGFGMTGNYHEFAFGPARDEHGDLYVALNTASNGAGIRPEIRGEWSELGVPRERMAARGQQWDEVKGAAGRMYARAKWRGWVVKLSPDGQQVTPFACGFRSPDGIGFDAAGRLLVTDNQGDWLGTSKVHHVREGHFHGHPASLVWREGWTRDPLQVPVAELEQLRTPAMALLPQGELANSPTQPIVVPDGVFGPFAGQTLIGEMNQKSLVRLLPEGDGDVSQAAAVPFLDCEALGAGNHRLAFTDDGSLWIGKTHLSWAGAEGLLRVRRKPGAAPFAVERVRLTADGFELRCSAPVDAQSLAAVTVRAHGYRYHRAYGSPKVDDRAVAIEQPELDADGHTVRLRSKDLAEGCVHTIELRGVRSRTGQALLGDRVYYTLLRKQ
ncbi:MAG: hypothetical protein KAI24_07325 [Planctomycetes bacterium]|nr:hypothetical protein [Planctomycetota bacterium]